jgi:hypothetical protein
MVQTKTRREDPAGKACHESSQTGGDTTLPPKRGEEKNEIMASTTSPDISIQEKLE